MKIEIYSSESENSITVIEKGSINPIPSDAILVRDITGIDWNDCMIQHHELMGWEPYIPF